MQLIDELLCSPTFKEISIICYKFSVFKSVMVPSALPMIEYFPFKLKANDVGLVKIVSLQTLSS